MSQLTQTEFERVEIRCGTIVHAEVFVGTRKAAIKLRIDFGPLGVKSSSAQITKRYMPSTLHGRQVTCVVNFPPKRIAGFLSEVLVLGFVLEGNDVVLVQPDSRIPNGTRLL
jgi:tRNA-binding protein